MKMQPLNQSARRRVQRGLTLIELMISMTIGLIVLGALTYVYVGSRGTYRTNENLARVQETGRFALDYLSQDLRMTSFAGCRSRSLAASTDPNATVRMLNITATPTVAFSSQADGIIGYEDGASPWVNPTAATATPITRAAGDVLVIRRATGMMVPVTVGFNPAARTVTLKHNAMGIQNGEVVMLADCKDAVLFRVTNSPVTTGIGDFATVLEFQTTGGGTGGTQGNLATLSTITGADLNLESRASVMRFIETTYFVGTNPGGQRSLYRVTGGAIEELVDGVEDIDLLFGVDTTLPEPDGTAESYVRASAVANWAQVVSARISVLAYGLEGNITTNTQTYAFRDTNGDGLPETQTAPDRRLRQVYSTTIALRNRVQ